MSKLEKAYNELDKMELVSSENSSVHALDPRSKILVTSVYLCLMLSLPLVRLSELLLFFVFPILTAAMAGIPYGFLFKRPLVVLPFALLIGVFNPIFDRETLFYVGSVPVSKGWVTFSSILVRGLLSVQGALLLILTSGFYNVCKGMEQMKVPALFTNQLLFVYRYVFVLIQESIRLSWARDSRSFGKKGHGVKVWSMMIGQLLIRTFERANRIHLSMKSRGFQGSLRMLGHFEWHRSDSLFLFCWCTFFLVIRIFPVSESLLASFRWF